MAKPKYRTTPITPAEASDAVQAYDAFGSTRKAAAGLEITRSALMRRLRKADQWGITEADFRRDPANASFYLEVAGQKVAALKRQDSDFDLVEWALKKAGLADEVTFLARDQRLEIAGIRHDQHGDLGPNGARGSAANISRTGEKTNIGHSHSAGIVHGCYQMGTMSVLRMGYTRGPSSWSHTLTLTYGNRKRANITLKNGKWRAI